MYTAAANLKTEPWPHQQEAIDFVRDKPGAMLAIEMGAGKSLCNIALMNELECQRTLIVCPLSIVDHVWPAQILTHSAREYRIVTLGDRVPGVKAKLKKAQEALASRRPTPVVVIINYDSAWREPLGSWLLSQSWDLVVWDEIHRLKSAAGKASRWASKLADRTPRRLGNTGTPMPNTPLDIYAQFRALNKRVYGTSNQSFRDRYAVIEDTGFFRQTPDGKREPVKRITGYQNLPELHRKFYSIAYRVAAADVLDLPEARKSYYPVALGPRAQQAYLQMEQSLKADLEEGRVVTAANALARLLRLQQLTSGYAPDQNGTVVRIDDAKTRALEDIIQDLGPGEPLVVFARFRPDLDAVLETAQKQDRPAYQISGEAKQLDDWLEHGGVLAVQIQAGGLGLDLTKARYCVYYSPGFGLGEYLQSMARLHRPGQTRPVQYIHLIAAGTVDELVVRALDRKEDLIDRVLTNRSLTEVTD